MTTNGGYSGGITRGGEEAGAGGLWELVEDTQSGDNPIPTHMCNGPNPQALKPISPRYPYIITRPK
jgi:hypothetical protein